MNTLRNVLSFCQVTLFILYRLSQELGLTACMVIKECLGTSIGCPLHLFIKSSCLYDIIFVGTCSKIDLSDFEN